MNKNRKSNKGIYIATALSILGSAAMIAFPEVSLEAAKKGIALWAYTVVPALLPFFICANVMFRLGVPQKMSRYFEGPVRRIFNVPGSAAFAFIMSITSGYPMGAKITADMRQDKLISKPEAERMMTFCSTSGPLFMLGAVGTGMLGSVSAGWVVAISHYIGAIFNGMIFRHHGMNYDKGTYKANSHRKNTIDTMNAADSESRSNTSSSASRQDSSNTAIRQDIQSNVDSVAAITANSIFSSFRTLALIGGYIVIFTLIVDFLEVFSFFAIMQGKAFAGAAKGFFEFTIGCSAISEADIPLLLKCAVCAAVISWGGLSTHFQIASIMSKTDVNISFYIKTKMCHAVLTLMIAIGMGRVLFKMADRSAAVFADVFATDMVNGSANLLSSFTEKITEISASTTGAISAAGISEETLITVQMFVNRLLFSSQMIIMIIVIFFIVTLLGRMSYEITGFIKRLYTRRKHAVARCNQGDTYESPPERTRQYETYKKRRKKATKQAK